MKIPKYWAKGSYTGENVEGDPATFSCWHWSDFSVDDARRQAEQRAQRIAATFFNDQRPDRYSYGSRPIREEVVETVSNGLSEVGLVTRNGYGALVLNAAQAMFIDIDFKPERKLNSLLGSLFGAKPAPVAPEAAHLPVIEQWVQRYPGLGLRVYRTAAGLRCLVISDTFDPTQSSSLDMMRSLGSDPLYVTLCKQQESFRARLTPKPWRCQAPQPPSRYPWESSSAEILYRKWQAEYQRLTANFAVCRLVAHYGSNRVHPNIEPVLTLHDQYCGVQSKLELA